MNNLKENEFELNDDGERNLGKEKIQNKVIINPNDSDLGNNIKSFNQFVDENKTVFVYLRLSDETRNNLKLFCEEHGISYKDDGTGFHVTIFYAEQCKIDLKDREYDSGEITFRPLRMNVIGKNNNCLVIEVQPTVETIELRILFEQFGLRDQWPAWKPHITLSYEWYDGSADRPPMPDFPLIADKLIVSNK